MSLPSLSADTDMLSGFGARLTFKVSAHADTRTRFGRTRSWFSGCSQLRPCLGHADVVYRLSNPRCIFGQDRHAEFQGSLGRFQIVQLRPRLGPGIYCSPRHRMPFDSVNEGSIMLGDVAGYICEFIGCLLTQGTRVHSSPVTWRVISDRSHPRQLFCVSHRGGQTLVDVRVTFLEPIDQPLAQLVPSLCVAAYTRPLFSST